MFVGAALVATSVGITARVLGNLGMLDAPTAKIILGAAVIDDILGLLILSVVSGLSKGSVDYFELTKTAGLSILFTIIVATIGSKFVTKVAPYFGKLRIVEPYFIAGLILCLLLQHILESLRLLEHFSPGWLWRKQLNIIVQCTNKQAV